MSTNKKKRGIGSRIRDRNGPRWLELKQSKNCFYCDEVLCHEKQPEGLLPHNRITFDHKTPSSQGGRLIPSNLLACCNLCNNLRGDLPYSSFVNLVEKYIKPHRHDLRKIYVNLEQIQFKNRSVITTLLGEKKNESPRIN